MQRSEINRIILDADRFIRSRGFRLPPFAYWTPEEWRTKGAEVTEIVDNQLGWDITDYGLDDYVHKGLFLFTIRNGNVNNLKTMRGKIYAEKIMIVKVDQITPFHFHWDKMEDIINRGGGKLLIQLFNSTPDGELDREKPLRVSMDGVSLDLPAGATVALDEGESISLPPYLYHQFWGAGEQVLVGEVSMVNDDAKDNRFLEKIGRFPSIVEDEPPIHLLVTDYTNYYTFHK